MRGNQDLIEFLQRAVGYSLTGDVSEQCLFLLYGTGANGKSVFVKTAGRLLGEYATVTPFETLLVRRGEGPRDDIADLRGARFVSAIEAEEGQRLAESLVKALTGDDRIKARFLYSEFFSFEPSFKLWLAANHQPIIRGTDLAIWRRIRLVPFTVTIPEGEQNPHLAEGLVEELPGILNWALAGCLEWQRDGLHQPDEVRQATALYRQESDPLAEFLGECCVVEDGRKSRFGELFSAYQRWAEANSEKPLSNRAFADRLTERGFDSYRAPDGRSRMRIGIGLVSLTHPTDH
jgi:putative DNA primase/helicase